MLKRFFSYYKPHLKLFTLDMLCALIVAVCNLFYPKITGNIIDIYVPEGRLDLVLIWSGVLLGIYVVKALLNYVIQYWGHVMGVRIQGDMRRDFFNHLQRLPLSYFDENKTGTIMSRIINDLFEISELAHHGPEDLFLSLISLVGALVMVALINPWLALITLAIVPLMCWFAVIQRRRQKQAFADMRKETGEINAQVESSVSGIRVSRAYTATNHELKKFEVANKRFQTARGKAYKQMGIFHSGMGLFADILYLVGLCAGGVFLFYKQIDGGQFTTYVLYITMIISPIRTLTAIFESIQNGMTGFARFTEIMDMPAEKDDEDAIDVDKLEGNIAFEHVTFHYNDAKKGLVLNDVSFQVDAGKTIALVGPSGGGKTTMCHLIPRFYELAGGKITIDGLDITKISRFSLRKNIGIVQQDVFLFGGSIRDNIAYGNVDATDEEILQASKRANIHEFVMSLSDGYDTEVGERGVKLSGGQKQRISIARAFLKNPPILILDEATSALDNVTEMQIQESLAELSKGRTTIVVAHRLSTIKNADEIMVVTKNGIEEKGTHQQLMAIENGIYADLYERQFKDA
ncbi:MAG: ABC transporter ATP-binding protein [Clostridia bacterium]|nr:ABC transporter ATP-binding protein [Clostridia bacterium]